MSINKYIFSTIGILIILFSFNSSYDEEEVNLYSA